MLEVKFRGNRVNGGGWVEGDLMWHKRFSGLKPYIKSKNINPMEWFEVHPESIGMFTGLKDKNGKEIFGAIGERGGDVVRWDDMSNGKYWRVCKIIWNKTRFELHGYTFSSDNPNEKIKVDFKFGQFIYEYDGALEIIGNTYDNPEIIQP
jgi:hypothetical protein